MELHQDDVKGREGEGRKRALVDVWQRLELPFGNRAMAAE
jgi:hypothetical protein